MTFPDTFSKAQIKLPPADFLKRMNSLSMGSLPSGPVGPALTMGGPPTPTGQLAITGGRHHPLVKPDFSLPTPKTTVTSLGVPEIQKLTGPNPTSHNINLTNQIRSSEASRKRSRNHEINLISYQKEVNCSLGFMSGPDRIIMICTLTIFKNIFPLKPLFPEDIPNTFVFSRTQNWQNKSLQD